MEASVFDQDWLGLRLKALQQHSLSQPVVGLVRLGTEIMWCVVHLSVAGNPNLQERNFLQQWLLVFFLLLFLCFGSNNLQKMKQLPLLWWCWQTVLFLLCTPRCYAWECQGQGLVCTVLKCVNVWLFSFFTFLIQIRILSFNKPNRWGVVNCM